MKRVGILFILCVWLFVGGVLLAAEGAPAEEEASPFSGGLGESIWTVLAFFLLLFVLWRMAWKPLLAGLNGRQEHIEKQIRDAEDAKKQANAVLADYHAKLADVDREGKKIIASHVKQAEKEAKGIVDGARNDAQAMRLRMEVDIERARTQAESDLLDEAGGIVLRLGEEILGRTVSDGDNQKLMAEAVERLRQEKVGGGGNS